MTESENQQLAELLFPDVSETPEDIFANFPVRDLPASARVTRYAPSPTGFMHIGGLSAALISRRLAHQSGGVFILRIEDTDKEREIVNGVAHIVNSLQTFVLGPDEGMIGEDKEIGAYGPYKQSERLFLYRVFVKELVRRGAAYPCFCSSEELSAAHDLQEQRKIKTGYYGEWAKHRAASLAEIEKNLAVGKNYAVRLRSRALPEKFNFQDAIKGSLTLPANDQDVIIFKSDGYPTYHLAHAIDDRLMHTTHVVRGEEWLSSVPLHKELFEVFGFDLPIYAHIPLIMKMDGTSKRKLSKRKDPEANVSFYETEGYPPAAVIEYLLNLANSNFEDWRREHPQAPTDEFELRLEKINNSGALFDLVKLADVSKGVIARLSAAEVYEAALAWAKKFNSDWAQRWQTNPEYSLAICGIERTGTSARKDIAKWSEMVAATEYFFDDIFDQLEFPAAAFGNLAAADVAKILTACAAELLEPMDRTAWMEKLKNIALANGFAPDTKTFKAAPEKYKGHVGVVAGILRVALTKRTNTPDLYEVIQVLGKERAKVRLQTILRSKT